jgi:deoxyribonuclease (pyrimidine dimer)
MRCNLVSPRILTDQHLLAERNELRMIPPLLRKKVRRCDFKQAIPDHFVLGKGHQTFWIDKFLYLEKRHDALVVELLRRGFTLNLSLVIDVSLAKQVGCYNDWIPDEHDFSIIKKRILERLLLKPHWYRYYSTPITIEWIYDHYGPTKFNIL